MYTSLPKGWITTTLGEIAWPTNIRSVISEIAAFRYVGLEHIEPRSMKLLGYDDAHAVRSSSLHFSAGDVLYGRLRPYLNKVWVAEFDGVCSPEFLVFQKNHWLNNEFLATRMNAEDFVAFADEHASGDRPRTSFAKLSRFELLLPPLAEQARIATKLTAAIERLSRGESLVARGQRRLNLYRQAVIDSAVSGRLIASSKTDSQDSGDVLLQQLLDDRRYKWQLDDGDNGSRSKQGEPRGRSLRRYSNAQLPDESTAHTLPKSWTWASIDQLAWSCGYGTSVKCSYDGEGPPVLRIPNVREGKLDISDLKYATQTSLPHSSFLDAGDMLIVRTNGSKRFLGRATVIEDTPDPPLAFASYLIRYRLLGDPRLWEWVSIAWNSELIRSMIDVRAKTTAGQFNLSLSGLANVAIPLPPRDEQSVLLRLVDERMVAADRLSERLKEQMVRSQDARRELMLSAFSGSLVSQSADEVPADTVFEYVKAAKEMEKERMAIARRRKRAEPVVGSKRPSLARAWRGIGKETDANRLFREAGFQLDEVEAFYEAIRKTPEVRRAFEGANLQRERTLEGDSKVMEEERSEVGRFRLIRLWLASFKNLKDFEIQFDPDFGVNVLLGWNGTGKSNLFEALVIIFRDLHDWKERNRWAADTVGEFSVAYEIGDFEFKIDWRPGEMRRPRVGRRERTAAEENAYHSTRRAQLALPRFVFGYYAGPTNRLADHFMPMKQSHYDRLREASVDDALTLATLLEKRRFFCAETHHAKYVLLAFSYREDEEISQFLAERMRIAGVESALFVVRKPRWAKARSRARDFWGATGIMRRVMERLREHSIAPMVLEQKVNYGYRSTTEDHYYFYLHDIESLHAFAAEYADARSFFVALESTDFSELIYDVKIQVRIRIGDEEEVPITFRQLSEGEQQLLMVLGLMRFTQSKQSLVLLDEPDTHLNPHWSVSYLRDLERVMSGEGIEEVARQSSQILMATHDPLVISSLVKEQVHLLARSASTGECTAAVSSVDPRGMGFSGILMSEMFGFRSDLDEETQLDLDRRVRLVGRGESLSADEKEELKRIDARLENTGFLKAFSDPYYAAFVRAWGRMYEESREALDPMDPQDEAEIDSIARRLLDEAMLELKSGPDE